MPVVRESEFHKDAVFLLNVPVTPEFRQTLRIYSMDPAATTVAVRVFGISGSHPEAFHAAPVDPILGQTSVPLVPGIRDGVPAFAVVNDLSSIANLNGASRVGIEVDHAAAGPPIWAFVSVTNNETQHVTVITPERPPTP